MLGLAAYGTPRARRALRQLGDGVAALSTAGGGQENRSQGTEILATPPRRSGLGADVALRRGAAVGAVALDLARVGVADARRARRVRPPRGRGRRHRRVHLAPADRRRAGERLEPAPTDGVQIAYGADSRLQSLLAVDRPGQRALAGVAAAWYFGNNPAKAPMYDPATGRTFDGVARDGTINRNSGAESTIHGLLSMLALDAAPDVAARARQAHPARAHDLPHHRGRGRRAPGPSSGRPTPGPARAPGAAARTSQGGTRELRRRRPDPAGRAENRRRRPLALGRPRHARSHRRRPAGRLGDPGLHRDRRPSPARRTAA